MNLKHEVGRLYVPPNCVRDFLQIYSISSNTVYDLLEKFRAVCLDLTVENRDASTALEVHVDLSEDPKTVKAGQVFKVRNTKMVLVRITTSVSADVVIGGVSLLNLLPLKENKRRGITL